LFLDVLFISISGWLFWLVVGKLSDANDIGIATFLYTLATFVSGIALLGFEFPVIKITAPAEAEEKVERRIRSSTFSTILVFEMVLSLAVAAILYPFLLTDRIGMSNGYVILTLLMLLFSSLGTLARYALLGTLKTRMILIMDIVSIASKFLAAIILLNLGYGALAILFATFIQIFIPAVVLSYEFIRDMGFRFEKALIRPLLKEGISNFPGKISKILIAPLSVILLGITGVRASDMGIFFISLTVSVVAGAFATSLATISLSTAHRSVVSMSHSFRFGLSLTAPLISLLIVFPKTILGLINNQYVQGHEVLSILAIAILPSILVFNIITKLNSRSDNRNLIVIGLVEFSTFVMAFLILVPKYGILAGALSVLISYIASSIVAAKNLDRVEIKIILKTCISIFVGAILGWLFMSYGSEIVGISVALSSAFIVNHILGTLKFREIKEVAGILLRTK